MTTTTHHSIDGAAGWTQVSTGSPSVTVQLVSDGPLLLAVGSAPPADQAAAFVLSRRGDMTFTGNALAGTDNVYVRALNADETERVVVMAT